MIIFMSSSKWSIYHHGRASVFPCLVNLQHRKFVGRVIEKDQRSLWEEFTPIDIIHSDGIRGPRPPRCGMYIRVMHILMS
jgi:hypothetical protein